MHVRFDCPRRSASTVKTPAPPHNCHRNTCGEMEHGAGAAGDAFSAVRGLMVLRSAAGTVHTVGCPSVLHASHLSEVNLCRTCVDAPNPRPPFLVLVVQAPRHRGGIFLADEKSTKCASAAASDCVHASPGHAPLSSSLMPRDSLPALLHI